MAVRSVVRPNLSRVSLFCRFSFVSAPRSDGGGSVIWALRAVRGPASHKNSKPKWQRAKALGADSKGFIGFGHKSP